MKLLNFIIRQAISREKVRINTFKILCRKGKRNCVGNKCFVNDGQKIYWEMDCRATMERFKLDALKKKEYEKVGTSLKKT